MDYEGHICRAPMERASFMLPVMVGCSYNRCKFCNLFKHLQFRILPFAQVEEECKRVAALGGSPKKVFFGDGNAFTFDADYLLRLINMTKQYFPQIEMINMDATVTSILQKTDDELKALYDAGVRHLYLGIETGLDDVLRFMHKDHTLDEAYEAIGRLQKAGLIYDAHIMSGIAGHGRGEENARALAGFFDKTHPAHVVNFSLFLQNSVPLYREIRDGNFIPATELENLIEDRFLVSLMTRDEAHPVKYDSFHDYIECRVRGTLPRDRERMVRDLDRLIAREEQLEEPRYADVFGTCPSLFDSSTGRYIWDTEAKSA
ncbi:MAG: radical SAM protein [Lachnospiraceae bacterium]|nr:radical SAM protein [Lachnospiraceae bacterium]